MSQRNDKVTCINEAKLRSIIEAAKVYHDMGMSIIPFFVNPAADHAIHDKIPMILTYKKWQTEPQTTEEFENLDWKGCNAFGVLLGKKTKDGRYLGVIDYDPKIKYEKILPSGLTVKLNQIEIDEKKAAIAVGEKLIKQFPVTYGEETVNRGTHLLYWSQTPLSICAKFHDQTAIELLGENKLCVLNPSYGYKSEGSDIITEVEDLEEKFYKIMKENGFAVSEKTEVQEQQNDFSFKIEKIIDLSTLEDKGDGQYQGCHPIHGSTTGKNFVVDTKKNQWHCFNHDTGGGALQYLAMKEGIITCDQAVKGALRGKKFGQVLQLAVANGLVNEEVLTQSDINPVILAKDIMEDYCFAVDKETNELYYYIKDGPNEGIYTNQTEQLILREITRRLDENFKAHYKREITEFILGTAPLVEMGISNPDLIAVQNGILNTKEKTLEKHTNKNFVLNKLPVQFKETDSTVWHDFMAQVLPNPTQRKQVQELVGHCLYGKISTETCLVLIGGGSNGKTIFLQTITKFLGGSKNVGSHSIQQLCYDKFVTGEIKGKLANICADLPHKELANTALWKALVSGDSVEAYIKHVQKSTSFCPTAKYIFSANQLPPVTNEEDCYAYYRRFSFAKFTVTFTKENSKPRQELLNSLSTPDVFSEILNWALEGLRLLFTEGKGDITDKPTPEEVRKIYIHNTDSALAYFEDKVICTDNPEDFVFTDRWFRDYVTYCHKQDKKAKSQGEFVNTVKAHLPGAEYFKKRPVSEDPKHKLSPISAWRYIQIKELEAEVKPKIPTQKQLPTENVPNVPRVPPFKNTPENNENLPIELSNKKELLEKRGTGGTNGTEPKAIFFYKDIPTGEKCDCGNLAVTKEIVTPQFDTLRVCEQCFKNKKDFFNKVIWQEGYADLPEREEEY